MTAENSILRGIISHDDLVTLTSWMADNDYAADDIAYAVEKPWKFADELSQAKVAEDR